MNKLIKKYFFPAGIMLALLTAACTEDLTPEITELEFSRLLSPTGMDVRVVNQTSIRLSWREVKNATSYIIEFHENGELDFEGTPVRVLTDITYDQLPVIVSGFAGETYYSVRVKALGVSIPESKWIPAVIQTDQEQILYTVNPEEIAATEVIIRWPAGEVATSILLTPGDIIHNITASEVTAGEVTLSGLQSETAYTAVLRNDDKIRGTVSFTTLIDLGGAIPVYPDDNLNTAIEEAQAGDVLVLFPGEYTVYAGDISINKSITIKGLYPHNKPVIYNRFVFYSGVTDASFTDLEMVGTFIGETPQDPHPQAFFFEAGTYNVNSVIISGCIIRNYSRALIYGGSAVLKVQNLTIHNCIMSDIVNDGGDFIDFRSGHVVNLTITNSTFNRVAAAPRDFIRLDNSSGNFPGSLSTVLIDRCTFYQVSHSRRILYVRFINNESTISNTIFAGADATYTGYFSNQAATTQPVCSNNNYFNASSFLEGVNNGKFDVSGTHRTLNPGFVNPVEGNFTLTNEDLKHFGIGDPRWLQ